jgi:hypothetical protein
MVLGVLLLGAAAVTACSGGDSGEGGGNAGLGDAGEARITQQDLEDLRAAVVKEAEAHGWAAGCIWETGALPDVPDAPIYALSLEGELGQGWAAGAQRPFERDGSGKRTVLPYATVYKTDYQGPAVTEMEQLEARGFFCFYSQ